MQKVTFKNSNGFEMEFDQNEPFVLGGISGISEGSSTEVSDVTVNKNGERYIKSSLDKKIMTLKVIVLANSENELMNRRRQLITLFNPLLGEGTLTYSRNNTTITIQVVSDGVPDMPYIGTKYKFSVSVSLIAFDPLFSNGSRAYEFSKVVGGISFPLEIDSEGCTFGEREINLIKEINNNGDCPCGVLATLTAYGEVENPSISILEDSISFKLNKTLVTGEVVMIDTRDSDEITMINKIDGEETDIIPYWDITSDLPTIGIGSRTVAYGADSGEENLGLDIEIEPRFIGI